MDSHTTAARIFSTTGISIAPPLPIDVSPAQVTSETLDQIDFLPIVMPPKSDINILPNTFAAKDISNSALKRLVSSGVEPVPAPKHTQMYQLQVVDQEFRDIRKKNTELLTLTKRYTQILLPDSQIFRTHKANLKNVLDAIQFFVDKLPLSSDDEHAVKNSCYQLQQACQHFL